MQEQLAENINTFSRDWETLGCDIDVIGSILNYELSSEKWQKSCSDVLVLQRNSRSFPHQLLTEFA
jgi:hypothetical protein